MGGKGRLNSVDWDWGREDLIAEVDGSGPGAFCLGAIWLCFGVFGAATIGARGVRDVGIARPTS